ncbi:MAG: hypothetical protein HY755_12720 [Nitrospirae bacterium]|nr:hypothetical protein [Nitrospirota bacterium]
MTKRFSIIILAAVLTLSSVSLLDGFDNNPNREGGTWIPYTKENIDSGKIKGGHDTITYEGMELKKKVHQQTDTDGGNNFINRFAKDALESLRIGAHDEDSTKILGIPFDDPPIGSTGWGGWLDHFYNPETGKGLKGGLGGRPATEKAKDYAVEIKKLLCKSQKTPLTDAEKKTLYELFGKTGHLLQDMGSPFHVGDATHAFQQFFPTWGFENYVSNNWGSLGSQIITKNLELTEVLNEKE